MEMLMRVLHLVSHMQRELHLYVGRQKVISGERLGILVLWLVVPSYTNQKIHILAARNLPWVS